MNLRKQLSSYIALNNYVEAVRENTSSVVLTDAIRNGLTGLQLKGSEVKNKPETFLDSVVAKGKTELRLPIERYDVLEYLEVTNDSQYIKTKVVPDWTTEIDAKFRTGNDKTFTVLSRWTVAPTADTFGVIVSSTSSNIVSYFGRYSEGLYQNDVSLRLSANQDVVYKLGESSVQMNEHNYSITRQNLGFENTLPLWIFKGNFLGEPNAVDPTGSRVYHLQIKTQGNLVFDGVPVRRKSDGMLGIYDKVSSEFLINQGTGDFVAGNVIDTFSVYLPEEYTQIDYVYMLPNSYLLTDIIPTYDMHVEMDFQTTTVTGESDEFLGGRAEVYGGLHLVKGGSTGTIIVDAFGTSAAQRYTSNVTAQNNTRYKFTYANQIATLESGDSVLFTNTMTGTNTNGSNLALKALNTDGTITGAGCGIYMYSFKVWNGQGNLIADYVPCKQQTVVGFYDSVSGQFLTATKGAWNAGAVSTNSLPKPDKPVDIWCNNGVLRTSINEFNANAITNGYFYNTDLEWVANSAVYITDYMKTVKGKYTLVLNKVASLSSTVNIRVNLFNANKDIQSQTIIPITPETTEFTYEVDIPDDISYVRISTNPIMVVISSFSNSNSVYTDGITETLQDSTGLTAEVQNLLASGNYTDGQSILDGTITRNVGVKVLDGTEDWGMINNNRGYWFPIGVLQETYTNVIGLCSHFDFYMWDDNTVSMPVNKFGFNKNSSTGLTNGNVTFRPDLTIYNTVDTWKQYLADQYAAGTPVIVVFPLATQTTETASSQKLLKNPVIVTEASIDNLEVTTTETEHTVPTPDYPLDIVCNNGVLKIGPNLFNADSSNITIGYWINNNTGEEQANTSNFMINGYIPVKSNTSYVAYGRRKTDNYLSQWNRIAWYDNDKNYISTSPYAQRTVGLGTSPENAAYARFSSNPTASTVTQDTVDSFNWTFREGTQEYTEFIPYNSVIVEGTPETITITGKNLFDKNGNLKTGTYRVDNGTWVDNDQFKTLDYIPGKPGVSYTLSAESTSETGGNAFSVQAWDSTHTNWLGTVASTTAQNVQYASGISPAGTAYLSVSFAPSYRDINTLQLEESSRPTKYEEYYQASFVPEDLLKLGDYQDIQDVINGIKSKKIGVKVLDGSEEWVKTALYTNLYEISLKNDDALSGDIMIALASTHLVGTTEVNANMPNNSIKLTTRAADRTNPLIFIKTSQGNDTLIGFKQYLAEQYTAGTPVIIVYPLADAIEETVESRDVFITSGTNTIERNSEYVSSGDITVGYKKLK